MARYYGSRGRGLKCPGCGQYGAWVEWGTAKTPSGIRRYRQKFCGRCNYVGKRRFYGGPIDQSEQGVM